MNKFQLEYPTKSSKKVLYNAIASPSGLSDWFADNVNFKDNGKIYVFIWDGAEQEAEVLSKKDNSHIRFRWLDGEDDVYFEFRIQVDEMTQDISLIITDFAEDEDEEKEQSMLWDTQVKELMYSVGG